MADRIENRNGQNCMVYAGETPWHKKGTRVETEITAAAAMKLAGLDINAHLEPMYLGGTNTVDGIPVIGKKIEDKQAVVRDDGNILGVVGTNYHVIQNSECFDFMDALIGEGQAVYHTAGSLFDGKRIFMTVKLPGDITIANDKVGKYLLLASSHDGSMAVRVKFTPIRVVCANTLAMSLADNAGEVSVRHTPKYSSKIEIARKTLGLAEYYYKQIAICFDKLVNTKVAAEKFVEDLLPGVKQLNGTTKVSTRTKNMREEIAKLSYAGVGNADYAGTGWGVLNGVTEYVDHFRVSKVGEDKDGEDVKLNSILFGSGAALRQKAFDLLTAGKQ